MPNVDSKDATGAGGKPPRRLRWWHIVLIALLWGYLIAVAIYFWFNQ